MSAYDSHDFQADVIERSHRVPVVVDFWAEWCGPCKMLGPVLEKLAGEAGGRWELAKVDTDAHRELAGGYGIRSIPNVKLFVDGRVVDEFVGALPEEAVRAWLDAALPSPQAARLERARDLLRDGGAAGIGEARTILTEVLDAEPDNAEAAVLLAEAILPDDPTAAVERVAGIDATSPAYGGAAAIRELARLPGVAQQLGDGDGDPAKQAYLAAIAAVGRRDWDAAIGGFIEVVGRDRSLDDDGARKACIAIFELLGEDAEVTRKHRRAFANAVFA